MPTLAQLEYILAVRAEGNFGRAAERCGVSQPTLSAQVKKAEEALGAVLFDRRSQPIQPTEAGRALLPRIEEVQRSYQELLGVARGRSSELRGRISLGILPTLAPYVLPWFLEGFARSCPEVQIGLFEQPTETILEGIRRQQLDAGLLATPLDEAGIEERVLFYDPFYVYLHPGDALLERGELSGPELDRAHLWLLDDDHCVRNQVVKYCDAVGDTPLGSVRFAAGSLETLRGLIDAIGGYTLIPETYARTLPRGVQQRQVRPLGDPIPTREVSLILPHRSPRAAILDALEAAIRTSIPRPLRRTAPSPAVLPVRGTGGRDQSE